MGEGAFTADGCPVEVYRLLPPGGEPGIVHEAVPEGASILELGSGVGRVTHALLDLGHPVVAVDDSPEMLADVRAEWHPPEWFESVRDAQGGRLGEVDVRLEQVVHQGNLLSAVIRYSVGDRSWTQAFTCRRLELPALNAALADAGLVFECWCTGDRTWFAAVPA